MPHFGLALTVEQWHALADRVRAAGVPFIVQPTLRFEGMPGEQHTMFFKDPSGNNLECAALLHPETPQLPRVPTLVLMLVAPLFALLPAIRRRFKAMTNPHNLFAKYNVE